MKVGEAVVNLLQQYGVELVFGIPGTHSIELYRGLSTSSIKHILPRHEQGAGFMADGYARLSGKPGVCLVITGAGVTNITTPMAEAYMDSVPLLVISPVNLPDGSNINRGRLHEITDQAAVTAPLTAFSVTVSEATEIPPYIAKAFAVFGSERPLPVHISIPLPILTEEIYSPWAAVTELPLKPVADQAQIEQARDWCEQARQPVIVAGGGTRFGPQMIVQLAERLACPVITTVAGRGVIPADHPLCVGAQLRAAPVQELLAGADLAVILGTELAETDHYNQDLQLPRRQIRVNVNPHVLSAPGKVLKIRADALDFAQRLAGCLASTSQARLAESDQHCMELRAAMSGTMTDKEKRHLQILDVVMKVLPEAAVIVSDMTQLAYTAIDFVPLAKANSWLHPSGYGTLGYAVPAAIGASLAEPERAVLVIVGDAGLQYTMQELTLAAELDLNITVLLWNNNALLQISDDMSAAGIEPVAVTQRNPDFLLLAQACGWTGIEIADLQPLGDALNSAMQNNGSPVLLQLNEQSLGGLC